MNPFWTNFVIDGLLVIYVIDCLFMWLVIMMQRSKQEGLGAAFGGGLTESVFGAQTSNVLVKATVWATIIFFVVSMSLARLYSHRTAMLDNASPVQQELAKPIEPVPTAPTNSTGQPVVPTATPMETTPAPATHASTWTAPAAMPTNQPAATPAKPPAK
jgi:preprotein translocase subunit SecG